MERLDELESIQDPDAIKNAVDDYLANNPVQFNETDPTVSDWAKEKEKPKYTADEVGALSKTKLSDALNDALSQAKDSGLFDGAPGPQGPEGPQGIPGNDYILTEADKTEIAEQAAELVDVPESSGGIPIPETAEVGQTIKVSAVDENGKPTAWEAVDLPSGGDNEKWELIHDFTATEHCNLFVISEDMEGNPFVLKKLLLRFYIQLSADLNESSNGGPCRLKFKDKNGNYADFVLLTMDSTPSSGIVKRRSTSLIYSEESVGTYLVNNMQSYNNSSMLAEVYKNSYTDVQGGLFEGVYGITSIETTNSPICLGAESRVMMYGVRE
jgi:hypothetical protein